MSQRRFGMLEGVFTPTLLSILGVIMFLRLGWVVGQVGLIGALVIIVLSNLITLFTALSAGSITTNSKVGAGGAYSLISRSLGFEVGGAIGVPLYLSQAISIAFYISGFAEVWVSVFPSHSFLCVALSLWLALLLISYFSAKLAFKLQYGVFVLIGLALVSAGMGESIFTSEPMVMEGLKTFSFWGVFAIFFPAVTGILAGISMSGELKKPEFDIPVGTLLAIAVSFILYVVLTFWFAKVSNAADLVANKSIILDLAKWRFLIVLGIMGATLSSALSMFVAAPRTLAALGKHRIIPGSDHLFPTSVDAEPTTAVLITSFIALLTLALGRLDSIAVVLTLFFLITYGMLNMCVFIEKGLGIVSFRPVLRVPTIVSFLGAVGCFYAMFLIHAGFSVVAILVIVVIYILLLRNQARRYWPDVRKGLFIYIAEKAMRIARALPYHPKIWKPNVLIPVGQPRDWAGVMDIVQAIVAPKGRLELFKIMEPSELPKDSEEAMGVYHARIQKDLDGLVQALSDDGMLASGQIIQADNFSEGARLVLQTKLGSFLPPNVLFMKIGSDTKKDNDMVSVMQKVSAGEMGVMLFGFHPKVGLGKKETINVWIRQGSPNVDLAVLVALQLEHNWGAKLRLLQVVEKDEDMELAKAYLNKVVRVMRLPKDTQTVVLAGPFAKILSDAPLADVNVFGVSQVTHFDWIREVFEAAGSSVLFLQDSKHESAFV